MNIVKLSQNSKSFPILEVSQSSKTLFNWFKDIGTDIILLQLWPLFRILSALFTQLCSYFIIVSTDIHVFQGNSPAGGCLMALACDYRIMADGNFSMGLNETKLVSSLSYGLCIVGVTKCVGCTAKQAIQILCIKCSETTMV